jgi:hypothetical protein
MEKPTREVEFAFRVTSLSLKADQILRRDNRERAPAALSNRQGDSDGYRDSEIARCDERLPPHSIDRRWNLERRIFI